MWSPDDIVAALGGYPGFVPGLVVSILIGFVVSERIGRALGVGRITAFALILSVALILSATLTPGAEGPRHGAASCDLSRLRLAPLSEVLAIGTIGLNIFLFVPLGGVIAMLPRSRHKIGLLAAAVALPFTIEAIQLLARPLARACQGSDVIDNLTGLAVGFFLGTLAGAAGLHPRWRR